MVTANFFSSAYLQQGRLRETAGEVVQLPHKWTQLLHSQLAPWFPASTPIPVSMSEEINLIKALLLFNKKNAWEQVIHKPGWHRILMLPGLLLAIQQLLCHRRALLSILCDQTKPTQQVVVREQLGVWLSKEGAKDWQAWGDKSSLIIV